jgi:DNA-binding CsgD family transcriptional regulator
LLASWLRERRRTATGEPLRIDADERALVIELVDGALLLEEQQRLPRLTAREQEILDLVAEGRTNAEIAERLWVSRGTVRKHLDNIYAKLGVHTRTAAAAFVGGQQLLPETAVKAQPAYDQNTTRSVGSRAMTELPGCRL